MPLNGVGLPTWALIAFVRAKPDRMCGPQARTCVLLERGGGGATLRGVLLGYFVRLTPFKSLGQ